MKIHKGNVKLRAFLLIRFYFFCINISTHLFHTHVCFITEAYESLEYFDPKFPVSPIIFSVLREEKSP